MLSGNQRLQILNEMNYESVPCVVVDLGDGSARLLAQALNRIEGEDEFGLKADLVRNILEEISPTEVLDLLPETSDSQNALVSLGESDLTQHLRNWEKGRAVKLHTLQLRLTEEAQIQDRRCLKLDRAFRSVKDMHDTLATWEMLGIEFRSVSERSRPAPPSVGYY